MHDWNFSVPDSTKLKMNNEKKNRNILRDYNIDFLFIRIFIDKKNTNR